MDIGWSELLLIGIVALIVIGPKDLPRMFAALGRFTAKARGMAREFQRAMDEAAKESGVSETAKDLRAMTSKKNLGLDKIEEAARKFESWDPAKSGRTAAKPAPGSETAKLAEKKVAEAEARREAATTTKASPAAAEAAKPAVARATKAAPAKAAPAKAAKAAAAKAAAAKAKPSASKAKPAPRRAKPKATGA